jgi:hypothetical protein
MVRTVLCCTCDTMGMTSLSLWSTGKVICRTLH